MKRNLSIRKGEKKTIREGMKMEYIRKDKIRNTLHVMGNIRKRKLSQKEWLRS